VVFYQEKQKRRGGDPARFVECISISPADGAYFLLSRNGNVMLMTFPRARDMCVFPLLRGIGTSLLIFGQTVWNTHARLQDAVAEAHIKELAMLTPPIAIAVPSPVLPAIDEKHNVVGFAALLFRLSSQA
jgi:hypothetical protein